VWTIFYLHQPLAAAAAVIAAPVIRARRPTFGDLFCMAVLERMENGDYLRDASSIARTIRFVSTVI
jgi:hypothetical protein